MLLVMLQLIVLVRMLVPLLLLARVMVQWQPMT